MVDDNEKIQDSSPQPLYHLLPRCVLSQVSQGDLRGRRDRTSHERSAERTGALSRVDDRSAGDGSGSCTRVSFGTTALCTFRHSEADQDVDVSTRVPEIPEDQEILVGREDVGERVLRIDDIRQCHERGDSAVCSRAEETDASLIQATKAV